MSTKLQSSNFPGRTIEVGQRGSEVLAIQRRLNALGCGPITEDAVFGPETLEAVQLFQSRSEDPAGRPLEIDGRVGAHTWAALFAEDLTVRETAEAPLLTAALETARAQIGVREVPPNSNRGPEVDRYIRSVGLDPAGGFPWCAAFVFWCFDKAANQLQIGNPVIRAGGVLDHWTRAIAAGIHCIAASNASAEPSLVQPGMIFIFGTDGGKGHTGLIERVSGSFLTTIEGNTNDNGSREGIGVFRRTARRVDDIDRGFIDYSTRA